MEMLSTVGRLVFGPAVPTTADHRVRAYGFIFGVGLLAHIGFASAAEPTVSHIVSGSRQSSDFRDPSNPGCSMGGAGPMPGSRLIMGASRLHPDPMSLVIRRAGWAIPPGTRIEVMVTFQNASSLRLSGTGSGNTIDILLGADQLPPWVHGLTASNGMQLSFGGSEPPWIFDLTGTTTVVNAMGDCFRSHQITGVGAPFALGVDTAVAQGGLTTQPFGSIPPTAAVPASLAPSAAALPRLSVPPQPLDPDPRPVSPGHQPASGDKPLMSWSGSGRMQTRPFHIDGPWELQWTRASGYFSAVLHPAPGTDGTEKLLASGSNADKSTSYQPKGGDFYFEFDASQQWTARIVAVPNSTSPPASSAGTDASAGNVEQNPTSSGPNSPAVEATPPLTPSPSITKPTGSCKTDWRSCRDNEDLLNNFKGYFDVKYDCQKNASERASYGTPVWPGMWSGGAFGRFMIGDDYVKTGIVTAVEADAQFQNGFGAMAHSTVICKYDLNTKKVVSVSIEPR